MADYLVQEDGTSKILQEDGTSGVLLETVPHVDVPFISSVTVVHAPSVDAPYTLDVLADSPSFYWKLADALSSSTAADSSGNGHTGTPHGSVTFGEASLLAGLGDTSAKLGGTTADWISGGDWDVVGSAITIECWIKPDGTPADCHLVAKLLDATDTQGAVVIRSQKAAASINAGAGYYRIFGNTVLASGSSYHIVAVYDGSYLRLYVNGVEDCDPVAATGSLVNNNWDWSVGAGGGAGEPFKGWMDEVAVYPAALSATDILKHYEDGAGLTGSVLTRFIPSVTTVYAPSLPYQEAAPFIPSVTAVYTPSLAPPEVFPPFIPSATRVYDIFSLFNPNWTGVGPGNGGELFPLRLAPNGTSQTATLAADIAADDLILTLTGDGGFPTADPFVVTIDSEVLYLMPRGGGNYFIRKRALSNTTAAAHTAGATVTWGDSYDQAIAATAAIASSFTADINGTGSHTYPGWLIAFDASQAYLAASRYPLHVAQLLGVFPAGTSSTGANRCDAAQPNAIATPTGVSDDCPAGLTNPSRIQTNIDVGDVALVRYTNPEASALDLGPRSVAVQAWFGLKRVDTSDVDVTSTNPNAFVVDSTGVYGTFTGSIDGEYFNPSSIGIAPDTGQPTPNPAPYTSATLPGVQRYFTYGPPHFSEKGWPIGMLAVRQGNRRVPHWESYDWHNYSYVYCGFGVDDTFAQVVVNRNGIVFDSLPSVDLPGPQDITGPDAVWDDGSYEFAVCWYVAIWAGPYLVLGPTIGGTSVPGGTGGYLPGVSFPGPGGSPGPPIVTIPPVEGGSGGDITPPAGGVLAWTKQGH